MPKQPSLFNRLTKLFRSGPVIKRRVKNFNQPAASSALEVFKKAHSDIYNNTLSAYGAYDRMSRYSDFSEMETTPEIASALDIYAEESVSADEHGRVLHIYSDNRKIQEHLEHLFQDVLNVEFNLVMWIRNLPVHEDTIIPLLDGRNIAIKEVAREIKEGKEVWVYSVQDKTKRTVPGKVAWCDLTRENEQIQRTWLDDGTYVDTSLDHEFILRDGTACRADGLSVDDSLMPFYRRTSSKESKDKIYGYEKVYDAATNRFVYTHRRVAEVIDQSVELTENDRHFVTHHKDFDKRNNDPSNLQRAGDYEHIKMHKELGAKVLRRPDVVRKRKIGVDKWLRSDRHRALAKEQLKQLQAQGLMRTSWDEYNNSPLHGAHNEIRSKLKIEMWNDPVRRARTQDSMTIKFDDTCVDMILSHHVKAGRYLGFASLSNRLKNDHELIEHISRLNSGTKRDVSRVLNSADGIKRIFKNVTGNSYFDVIKTRLPSISSTPWFARSYSKSIDGSNREKAARMRNNHAVAKIEILDKRSDTYCMEVTGPNSEHDRHNFMILGNNADGTHSEDSGICVANCKYGDFFLFNDVSPEYGIIAAYPIAIAEMEREEGFDPDDPLAARFRWVTQGNQLLENWQVAHFRLLGNDAFLPYGSSVLESARRIWRQLILIEDAMLVYRVIRAPERRVFYIDVGNVPPEDVANYLEQAQTSLKRNQVIDRDSGRVDLRYNPLSVDEDYFLPVRGSESGTKIETLAGGQNTAAIEDVQYIQKKLFAALKIPRAYLGYDEDVGAKATLAQEDIRFSRSIQRIQKTIVSELNKLAMIHLYCHGYEGEELADFELRLSNPSTIAQQQKLELIRTRFEIAGTAPEGSVSRAWIQKNVLGLNEEEIKDVIKGRIQDKINDAEVEAAATGEEEAGMGGGAEAAGGEEGGLFAADEPEGELLTALPASGDYEEAEIDEDEDVIMNLSIDDDDAPIKAQNAIMNAFGETMGTRRVSRHGPASTHMPDFAKMTSAGRQGRGQDTLNHPFDDDFMKSPFKEAHDVPLVAPRLTLDLVKTLGHMSNKIGISKQTLLSESDEELGTRGEDHDGEA